MRDYLKPKKIPNKYWKKFSPKQKSRIIYMINKNFNCKFIDNKLIFVNKN